MSQNRFRPINEAHAIVEQMIFFQFAPTLEQAIPALLTLKEELRNELPQNEFLKSIRVDFVDNAPSSQEIKDAAGIVLFKIGESGNRDWLINISPETISIHCTSYTRWDEVFPIYKRYISAIFPKIKSSKSFLGAVGTRWIDQFVYDGVDEDYKAEDLLREGTPYLNVNAFRSGPRWHCHTGWFERGTIQDHDVLNQLNVDSARVNIGGHLRTAVVIDHTQQLRADQSVDQLGDFLPTTQSGLSALSGLLNTLHDGNKRVLVDLLNDSSCERIALGLRQQG